MGDFAAAGRMADVDRVPEIERGDELLHVGGVGVHFVAAVGLARAAVAASIMGDDPVAFVQGRTSAGCPNRRR